MVLSGVALFYASGHQKLKCFFDKLQIYDLLMLRVGGDRDEFEGRYSLEFSLFPFLFLSLCMFVSLEGVDEILKCCGAVY